MDLGGEWGELALLHGSAAWAMLPTVREARADCSKARVALDALTLVIAQYTLEWRTCTYQRRKRIAFVQARSNFMTALTQALAYTDVLGASGETFDRVRDCVDHIVSAQADVAHDDMSGALGALAASLNAACDQLVASMPLDDTSEGDYVSVYEDE